MCGVRPEATGTSVSHGFENDLKTQPIGPRPKANGRGATLLKPSNLRTELYRLTG